MPSEAWLCHSVGCEWAPPQFRKPETTQHPRSPLLLSNHSWHCYVYPVAGILKFHEHYLGDNSVESSSDFQAGSSATLPIATSSALEQHIASVREALGVESYYSR